VERTSFAAASAKPYHAQPAAKSSSTSITAAPAAASRSEFAEEGAIAAPALAPVASKNPVAQRIRISGLAIAAFAYFTMFALLLSRLVTGWPPGRRLIRASRVVRDPRAHLSLSLRAFPSGIEEPPLLAESDAVTVPVTLGVARPVILLPSDWRDW